MPIRVSIVEDDNELRQQLVWLINRSPGFRCISDYRTADEALRRIPREKPDVVLMDIELRQSSVSGIECVRPLKATAPGLQILMLTQFEDTNLVFDSLLAGASGYLLKREPHAKLLEAIKDILQNGSPMTSQIARKVVQFFHRQGESTRQLAGLTAREQEVLEALAQGFAYKEIADRLSITMDTVRFHLKNIYEKLHVHSRTEAVVKYLNGKHPTKGK